MPKKQNQINLKIVSPIPEAMRSQNDRTGLWDKLGVIPYRGCSKEASHRYLKLLFELYEHSPSFGAIVNDITTFGFDGEIELVRSGKLGFKSSESDLSDTDTDLYCEYFETIGINPLDLIEITKEIVTQLKVCGNAYLAYRRFTVNDSTKVSLKLLHPKYVMYQRDKKGKKANLVYSTNFANDSYSSWIMQEQKFDYYSVYPNVKKSDRSTETVFHIKKNGEVYGEPEGIQSIYWQFVEYALGNLSSKVTSNEFVATHLLEVPRLSEGMIGSEADGLKWLMSTKKALQEALTATGQNASSIGLLMNPSEENMKLHKIDVNRDTDWFKCQEETAKRKIYEIYRHFPQLSGSADLKSGLGQDTLTALYLAFDSKTIKPIQRRMSNEWMQIMNFIADDTNNPERKDVKFRFPNNVGDYINNIKEARGNAGG